jgi:hypothetical protein
MARAARDGVHRRNQHSFTMARSALLLTSFIITLDSMIYRITNFSLAGRQKSSLLPTTCDQLSWRRIRLTRSAKAEPLVTHFTPFMHKLAVQSILAVRVGAQAVGCIWTDECELLASSECVERLTMTRSYRPIQYLSSFICNEGSYYDYKRSRFYYNV